MNIAVLSDIYGNYTSLETCLDYLIDGLGKDTPELDAYPSTVGMLRYAYNHITKFEITKRTAIK